VFADINVKKNVEKEMIYNNSKKFLLLFNQDENLRINIIIRIAEITKSVVKERIKVNKLYL